MANDNTAIKVTSIISGVVLLIAILAFFLINTSTVSSQDTVNVQGVATIKAMPDLIGVYFNIETKGETSAEAKDANSEILNDLIVNLAIEGISRDEIVTENYNIYPNYEWNDGDRKENGYVATHSVKVEISEEDSDKLGDIVDAGVDAGAGISYINFELSQELQNTYKAEAMKLAAQDAKIKAESVAEGFDKKVGKLVSVNVNDFGYSPWNVYSSSGMAVDEDVAMAKEAATNIQPGEREITSRVSAVFKLK